MAHVLQVDIVYGMDGTGGVNKWNGLSAARSDFSDHLLYAGMAMTGIRLGEPILPSLIDHPKPYPIIYQVPTPSSTDNERPLVLVSGGEKDPILDEITAKWDQSFNNPFILSLGNTSLHAALRTIRWPS